MNVPGLEAGVLKCRDEKVSHVLRRVLGAYQLTYIVYEGSFLVTTRELAAQRQLRQRINVAIDDVPLQKAVRTISRVHAFNLVIDPKVAKEAESPVSLHVEETSVDTCIRLLAEMAGLKAVRMDNVLFVTTVERAEMLRKEEQEVQSLTLNVSTATGDSSAIITLPPTRPYVPMPPTGTQASPPANFDWEARQAPAILPPPTRLQAKE
jgi:nitrogen regulatory protein PII